MRRRVECQGGRAAVTASGVAREPGEEVARRVVLPLAPLVLHSSAILLEQRAYALCLGHEDLNDHHASRCDTLLQTAAEREGELGRVRYCAGWRAGSTTRGIAWALHVVILERVIALLARASPKLFLDFGATTNLVHGR